MKNNRFVGGIISMGVIMLLLMTSTASAYWLWTPETKKFVNPKYAVKDSPKEQFDYAMTFYQAKDYQKAAAEFEKLAKQYEYSEYASKAQYYVGLCYENMNKLYIAFQNYQKAIDNFPHTENLDEIIAREFNIANIFASKASPKVLGTDILTSTDRAVEVYKKVAENAPFGKLAEDAHFRTGTTLKKADRFDEAIEAFQKILDDYPNSQFYEKAKFEVADCAYKASLKPAYDIESTDKAIKAFEEFSQGTRDKALTEKADKTIQRLRDKSAEKSLMTAKFYEDQRHYESAIIYYKDVIARFPDSSFVKSAKAKIAELERKINKTSQVAADKAEKKSWMPFNLPKKAKPAKQKPVVVKEKARIQGKGWFSFMKPAKKETPIEVAPVPVVAEQEKIVAVTEVKVEETPAKEAVQAEPVVVKEEAPAAKKKGWAPLSFMKPTKKKEPKKESTESAQVSKTEKPKGWWNPLSFANKPKPKKEKVPAVEKKSWAPLSFMKPVKKEEAPVAKKKAWSPLSFTKPAKKEAPKEEEAVKEEPAKIEAPAQTAPVAEVSQEKPAETKTEEPPAEEFVPAYKEY